MTTPMPIEKEKDEAKNNHSSTCELPKDNNVPLFSEDITTKLYVITRNIKLRTVNECNQVPVAWRYSDENSNNCL